MKELAVRTGAPYSVFIGDRAFELAATYCQHWQRTFVLGDANVLALHGGRLASLQRATTFAVPPGEASKSFSTLESVLDAMVAAGLNRSSGLVALGGGVVGDLGGLAAALYMRGIGYVQVPTTLLAMVDSSVGGKTAVNLAAGKNLAGIFHQPLNVYADPAVLATLPDDEYRSGLGEVVKSALIEGDLFSVLESRAEALLARSPRVLEDVVAACVELKAAIVRRDPFEKNVRKHLNLGHTFAHAIEHAAGFGRIPHGLAVGVGIDLALGSAQRMERLFEEDLRERVRALLARLGMPSTLGELRARYDVALRVDELVAAMRSDKKSKGGKVNLVLLVTRGRCLYDVEATPEFLRDVLASS